MKSRLLLCCSLLVLVLTAQGGIIYSPTGGTIPDGNPTGWASTATVDGELPTVWDVTVTLKISGGYNGDLYAYLSYGGALVPLLNRVGKGTGSEPTYSFGYGDAGFNSVTLADSGSVNIHNYGGTGVPTGTYAPDSGGVKFAHSFRGLAANGTWTLLFADLSSGATSTVDSWSLNITAVPEPINVALAVFGGVFVAAGLGRSRRVRNFVGQALVRRA